MKGLNIGKRGKLGLILGGIVGLLSLAGCLAGGLAAGTVMDMNAGVPDEDIDVQPDVQPSATEDTL